MKHQLVESSEIIRCKSHDRYIYVVRKNNEVVGLNFMQGSDETDLNHFKENYCKVDEDLTAFYNAIKFYLNGESEVERFNQAMWSWFSYHND